MTMIKGQKSNIYSRFLTFKFIIASIINDQSTVPPLHLVFYISMHKNKTL
jgi:hypothetical protein